MIIQLFILALLSISSAGNPITEIVKSVVDLYDQIGRDVINPTQEILSISSILGISESDGAYGAVALGLNPHIVLNVTLFPQPETTTADPYVTDENRDISR